MHWRLAALFAFVVMLIWEPAHAQDARMSRRFSVDLGLGSHFKDGGDVESISVGFAVSRIVALAATVERSHIPTNLRTSPDGHSVTRNGTLTSISGELRLSIPAGDRWTPYGIVGTGVGESVLNVNESFRARSRGPPTWRPPAAASVLARSSRRAVRRCEADPRDGAGVG